MRIHKTFLVLAATAAASIIPLSAASADSDNMTQAIDYFHAHSFDFPQNFRFQHPGPEWVLKHEADFKLTPKQTAELKKLSKDMFDDMKSYDVKTQEAHDKYAKDGQMKDPSETELRADIDKIGKATDELAYTMIPYHLKSYALLNSEQKKTFDELVAQGEGKK